MGFLSQLLWDLLSPWELYRTGVSMGALSPSLFIRLIGHYPFP